MNFVILDLEWNSSYCKKKKNFMSEIIEFGAVKFNDKFEVLDTFSMLIVPQVGKKLSGKIKELTNISNEELAATGNTYTHVLSKFKKFLGRDMLMTWGTCDILALMENTEYYEKNNRIDFISSYCDIQHYCATALGVYKAGQQLGLAPAAELLGLDVSEIVQHRALQDSLLSMVIFKNLYDPAHFDRFITTSQDLYNRLTFKSYYLTDINDPLVNKDEFSISCDKCGGKTRVLNEWAPKNKSFCAILYCDCCKQKMSGKIKFKINYDGMSIKKKIVPYVEHKKSEDNEIKKSKKAFV